ncbi:MAG: hypothetical protein ABF289_13475 [Clostridiales bacterium]
MELFDLMGFYLKDVLEILNSEGFKIYKTDIIVDPKLEAKINDKSRIVRIDEYDEKKLRIIVC